MNNPVNRPMRPVSTKPKKSRFKLIAENRQARYHYAIAESYASPEKGEVFLINANIPEYLQANRFNHEPKRPRKLLLHSRQIAKLFQAVAREGMTVVPLKMFFNDQGRAKVEIALAKGKQLHDKRQSEKERDWNREKGRILRDRG
jgi:SsrA-binding protein